MPTRPERWRAQTWVGILLISVLAIATFAADVLIPHLVLFPVFFPLLLLSAFFLPPVAVGAVGGLALVLALAAGNISERLDIPDYWARVGSMAAFVVLSVALARFARRRTSQLADAADDAAEAAARAERASALLRQVVDATESPIFVKSYDGDDAGRYLLTNRAWHDATGFPDGADEGHSDADLFPADVAGILRRNDLEVMRDNQARVLEERVRPPGDADARTFQTTKFPLRDADGRPWGIGGISTDVTELTETRDRMSALFSLSPTPTLRLRVAGPGETVVLATNDAMTRLVGEDLTGAGSQRLRLLVRPDETERVAELIRDAMRTGADGAQPRPRSELHLRASDGTEMVAEATAGLVGQPSPDDPFAEVLLQMEDVTARVAAEQALATQALSDPVTGLPNRFALHDRLGAAIRRMRRHRGLVGVLFCDLDHFKQVNDTLGHPAGDALLVETAQRLTAAVRPGDSVARIGGDEFVVLCEELEDPTEAALVALRLRQRMDQAWTYDGHVFTPTVSVGVATSRDPQGSADDLLRRADLAMYRAKDAGRNQVAVYDHALDTVVAEAQRMQERLRGALDGDGLLLHYQPIARLSDEQVVAAEALVRMCSPDGSLELPGAFIPRAEASGLIAPLGAWVLRTAFDDLRRWRHLGLGIAVSVNVSPVQLHRPGFPDYLLEQASLADVDPSWVIVEVTETALLGDASDTTAHLTRLHDAGMTIALDDFGTGYSSLSWLTSYPVDIVKVDRSFIARLGQDRAATAIVSGVVGVARTLGLTTIAEGVETAEQLELLRELGCDQVQGFLLGRPVPFDDPSWTAGRLHG